MSQTQAPTGDYAIIADELTKQLEPAIITAITTAREVAANQDGLIAHLERLLQGFEVLAQLSTPPVTKDEAALITRIDTRLQRMESKAAAVRAQLQLIKTHVDSQLDMEDMSELHG